MNIRKFPLFLLLLFTTLIVSSQIINQDSAWFRDHYYKIEKAISVRDGVKLFTSMYVPGDSTENEGYIMVIQDVRGRRMSEGKFVDVRPFIKDKKAGDVDESTDAYDAIDRLVKNVAGKNGKEKDFQKSSVRIFRERQNASVIILPVLSGKLE